MLLLEVIALLHPILSYIWQRYNGTPLKFQLVYFGIEKTLVVNTLRSYLSKEPPELNGGWRNSFPPGQNDCHFADDVFKYILLNENVWI